jgi:hypothetical protein
MSPAVEGWPEEESVAEPAGAPPDDVPRASEAVGEEPERLSDAAPEPRRSPCAEAPGRAEDGFAPVARPVEGVSGEAEAPAVGGEAEEPPGLGCATAEVKAAGAPRRSAATAAPVRKRAVFKESSCMAF